MLLIYVYVYEKKNIIKVQFLINKKSNDSSIQITENYYSMFKKKKICSKILWKFNITTNVLCFERHFIKMKIKKISGWNGNFYFVMRKN